jgi:hypothetical protein
MGEGSTPDSRHQLQHFTNMAKWDGKTLRRLMIRQQDSVGTMMAQFAQTSPSLYAILKAIS